MKALLKAVRDQLETSGVLAARASGGIYAGRAAAAAPLPYLVWTVRETLPPQYSTGATTVERVVVGFEAFSTSAAGAVEAGEEVERLFTGVPPALESGSLILVRKVRDALSLEAGTTGEAEEIWRAGIDLEFMVERNPAG